MFHNSVIFFYGIERLRQSIDELLNMIPHVLWIFSFVARFVNIFESEKAPAAEYRRVFTCDVSYQFSKQGDFFVVEHFLLKNASGRIYIYIYMN